MNQECRARIATTSWSRRLLNLVAPTAATYYNRRVRRVVLCGVLAGCFSKPARPLATQDASPAGDSIVSDAPVDGPQRNCMGVAFGSTPTVIGELNPFFQAEPTMTADMLEVYFTSDPDRADASYLYDVRRGSRMSVGEIFTLDINLPTFNANDQLDMEASITGDGLMIAFVSRRSGDDRAYYATRPDRQTDWTAAILMPGLANERISNLDLSTDGLTLYYPNSSSPSQLLRATRTTRTEDFTINGLMLGADRRFPTVSTDGRELFYYDNNLSILWSERESTAVPFDPGVLAATNAFDPDLLPGDETLIATSSSGSGILVFQRTCPAL